MTTGREMFAAANPKDGDTIEIKYDGGVHICVWHKSTFSKYGSISTLWGKLTMWADQVDKITEVTVLQRALPPEPPVGTIVIVVEADGNRRAAQRIHSDDAGWRFADSIHAWWAWGGLHLHGRTVIQPEEGKVGE